MDEDDETTPVATAFNFTCGQVSASIEMSVGLTPEMIGDVLRRARREVVAGVMDLGLVAEVPAPADQP